MAKGSDLDLGNMHGLLTRYYMALLDKELEALEAASPDIDPDALALDTLLSMGLSPAHLTAMNNFLKQNDITCVITDNDEVSALQQKLAAKRKRGQDKLDAADLGEVH